MTTPSLFPPTYVPKAWGMEVWLVNSPLYCSKLLIMDEGWQTSLHYHPTKNETMTLLQGEATIELVNENDEKTFIKLETDKSITLPNNQKHRIYTDTGQKAIILETSTQHSDYDVERLEESRQLPPLLETV